nr:nuclear receptor subfamily 0 group B member 2-like [Pelodiscus sinensis]|eukprot:XP_006132028.2 nuclear receptor subfamily 0 group B member 2-like [Pelodiscus sinensis]
MRTGHSVPAVFESVHLHAVTKAINFEALDTEKGENSPGASLAEVQKMKNSLEMFWNLDICAKEYAYLKGIILFNPELPGLRFRHYVQTLQLEAQHTLMEFSSMMYNQNVGRFAWILGLLASLKAVTAESIAELFFRPILGEVNINELLLETVYFKQDLL